MKLPLLAFAASLVVCSTCTAQSVAAGQDSLHRALAKIVPEPFEVNVDSRIPADTVLRWDDSVDWMAALKQAAAKSNLMLRPRWDAGLIDVVPGPKPAVKAVDPTPTVAAAAPVSAPVAVVAAVTMPRTSGPAATGLMPTSAAAPAPVATMAPTSAPGPVAATAPTLTNVATTVTKPAVAERKPEPEKISQIAKPTPVKAPTGPTWSVQIKDLNLATTFQRWAAVAGWKVRWDADKHVMVEAPDSFTGSFEDAVTAQLSSPGIAYSSYPLEVCFYPNTPPLARVTRKGDQAKECQ
ncbi:Toxin co-regulated pilus biosynthesis protein Q (plasmid) [Variovorax sp. SRS16]|uniref:toxin co-regulated pilus biosynthesis Q family protein n=1 Tax=Variovorax sp. SRS16 TaxID=282217 RepID=UPI001315F7EE|nr:toxin co-regulated pilus biosynthesis Q family protein [Variovorax sp. SRS16]VTU46189.1 Toxin co-regulated pilus biosynthesis protein Q [Variovorax sp. SRS16]